MTPRDEPTPPLDLSSVERDLALDGVARAEAPAWLRESHRDPQSFWRSLVAWTDATSPVRTKLGARHFDPWHELVVRNLGLQTPVLQWVDGARGLQSLGASELADRATRRALAWERAGAAPGQVVCIVRPMGPELFVSLVAALKAGLVLSVLPPLGARFVATRLADPPDFIDTDAAHRALVGGATAPVLPDAVSGDVSLELHRSVSYASGATAALLFDPCLPATRRAVSVDALLLCALRDGTVALSLRRGDVATAPGLPLLDTVPALPFAALICGATLLHLTVDDVRREPAVLGRPLRAVGLGVAARELLLERPIPTPQWHLWFRDPAESLDLERWEHLVGTGLHDSGAANLRFSAALGGCLLFSHRRKGRPHMDVLPSAGVPHTVADFLGGAASPTGHGRLSVSLPGSPKPVVTSTVIVPHGRGWHYGGSVAEGSRGRRFLLEETLEVVADLPGSIGASVCLTPTIGGARLADLLLFTGARPVDEAALITEARRRLEAALGAEHLPDRVLCLPVVPRRAKGGVDHGWCRDQYLSGGLARRADDALHRALARLVDRVTAPGA